MRTKIVIAAALLVGLAACGKPKTDTQGAGAPSAGSTGLALPTSLDHLPTRRAGLWIQTMTRDGAPGRMGEIRMCLDAATDAKMSTLSRDVAGMPCRQTVSRGLDGAYAFTATCKMGAMGEVTSKGTATGDFSTYYKIHSEADLTGSQLTQGHPSHHVSDIEGHYAGACPANMVAGDISLGGSMTVNVNKMPSMAAAFAGH